LGCQGCCCCCCLQGYFDKEHPTTLDEPFTQLYLCIGWFL
jgi:hypothetical protein